MLTSQERALGIFAPVRYGYVFETMRQIDDPIPTRRQDTWKRDPPEGFRV